MISSCTYNSAILGHFALPYLRILQISRHLVSRDIWENPPTLSALKVPAVRTAKCSSIFHHPFVLPTRSSIQFHLHVKEFLNAGRFTIGAFVILLRVNSRIIRVLLSMRAGFRRFRARSSCISSSFAEPARTQRDGKQKGMKRRISENNTFYYDRLGELRRPFSTIHKYHPVGAGHDALRAHRACFSLPNVCLATLARLLVFSSGPQKS